jgi:hypothetical protein
MRRHRPLFQYIELAERRERDLLCLRLASVLRLGMMKPRSMPHVPKEVIEPSWSLLDLMLAGGIAVGLGFGASVALLAHSATVNASVSLKSVVYVNDAIAALDALGPCAGQTAVVTKHLLIGSSYVQPPLVVDLKYHCSDGHDRGYLWLASDR